MGKIGVRQHLLFAALALFLAVGALIVVQKTILTQAAPGINKTINFQGKMSDSNGLNVADGNYQFVFSFYTVSFGGSNVWTETVNLDVNDGIFQHNLGSSTALPGSVDFDSDNIFLGITFNSDPDGEMSPRIQLTASPYAFNSDQLDGLDASDFLQLNPSVAQTGDIAITGDIAAGSLTLDDGSSNTATVVVDSLGGNYTYTIPTTAGDDNFCLEGLANCAGTASVGTFDSQTPAANGAVASGSTLYFQSASASVPGMVNTTTQSFAGTKTFGGGVNVSSGSNLNVASGTLYVDGSSLRVGIGISPNTKLDVSTSSLVGLRVNQSGSSNILELQSSSSTVFSVDNTGDTVINATLAVSGTVTIGTSDTTGTLLVLDTKTGSGDPTGANGGMYYNSNANKFRCYQNSTWADCIGSAGGLGDIVNGGQNGAIIIGTNDSNTLALETNNSTRFTISASAATLTGTSATSIIGGSTLDLTSDTVNAVTLDSGTTGTVNVGTNANAKTVNIGTGAAVANSISIGGTGANTIAIANTQTGGSVNMGAAMTTGTITIGGTGLQTGTLTFGGGTGAQTVNLGTGSTGIKTINLGTGTAANVISIGTGQTAGSVSIGTAMTTGTISIGGTGLQTGTISLGTGTGAQTINLGTGGTGAKSVTLGSTASTGTTIIQSGSGNITMQAAGTSTIGRIQLGVGGAGSTTPDFLALDVKSTTGDPAGGAEGYMYYNTLDNKFRCYEGSAWTDCIGSGGGGALFTDAGTQTYLTSTSDELVIGSSSSLSAKLSVVGTSNQAQFLIRANSTQTNPLVIFQNSGGSEIARLHADSSSNLSFGNTTQSSRTSGGGNIGLGYYALQSANTGDHNIAMGESSLRNTTGTGNVAIGQGTLQDNTSGGNSIAIGYAALSQNASGGGNIALGYQAMTYSEGGNENIGLGGYALQNTTGNSNIAIGPGGLQDNTSGGRNLAIGSTAAQKNTTGSNNIALGYGALHDNLTGNSNIAFGEYAGDNLTSGSNNIIFGSGLDFASATGSNQLNIAGILTSSDYTSSNLIVGKSDTTGQQLVLDIKTGAGDPTGIDGGMYYNSNAGKFRCYQASAWVDCISGGAGSGDIVNGGNTTGSTVTIGTNDSNSLVLETNSTARFTINNAGNITQNGGNLQLGGTNTTNVKLYMTGTTTTAGSSAYGFQNDVTFNTSTAAANIYGLINTPIVSASANNIAAVYGFGGRIDIASGYANTISNAYSVAALRPNTMNGVKVANLVGLWAGLSNSGSSGNSDNTTGTLNNYGLRVEGGTAAAGSGGTLNNFGARITLSTGATTNTTNYGLRIDGNGGGSNNWALHSTSTAPSLFSGTVGYANGTADTATAVCRNAAGQLAACTSSARHKSGISDLDKGLTQLRQLQPVNYTWNTTGKADVGFIAEQVASIIPEAVTYNEQGEVASFNPNTITALLVSSVKELAVTVDDNARRISLLEQKAAVELTVDNSWASNAWVEQLLSGVNSRLQYLEQGVIPSLAVGGTAAVTGDLNVAGVATVASITVQGKIITAGSAPVASVLGASTAALTVTGNDTAGEVNAAYELAGPTGHQFKVTFTSPFSAKPRVNLTPTTGAASSVQYYTEATNAGFTVYFTQAPAAGETYGFNYFVVQ